VLKLSLTAYQCGAHRCQPLESLGCECRFVENLSTIMSKKSPPDPAKLWAIAFFCKVTSMISIFQSIRMKENKWTLYWKKIKLLAFNLSWIQRGQGYMSMMGFITSPSCLFFTSSQGIQHDLGTRGNIGLGPIYNVVIKDSKFGSNLVKFVKCHTKNW